MRHNIFDSMPSNIVSGKNNVFANFLQTAGLYIGIIVLANICLAVYNQN